CRRTLPDPADAEDAFQAAFLVLVRRANRLTGQATVGPWLYRVAAWTARNLRRRNARRLARRAPLCPDTPDRGPGPGPGGLAAVPGLLAAATARAAGAAKLALAGTVSASVSQLVEGVLHMFWVQKATAASLGLVVVFGLGLGVGMGVRQVPRAAADDTAPRTT